MSPDVTRLTSSSFVRVVSVEIYHVPVVSPGRPSLLCLTLVSAAKTIGSRNRRQAVDVYHQVTEDRTL